MSTNDDLDPQSMARAFGLDKLANSYPEDIERAAVFAKSLAERLPHALVAAEEPANVFRSTKPELKS